MIRRSAIAAGVVVIALALTACGQQAGTSTKAADTSVVFSNISEPTTLDPAIAYSSDGFEFVRNVYEGLTMYEPGGVKPVGDIAKSWAVNSDSTVYTFTLRSGLTFHDGSKLTGKDVVESINRVKGVNQGPATLLAGVKSVEAPDDLTVVITLSAADVFLPGKLQKIAIVSAASVDAHKTTADPWASKWFADHENGSGPYKLASWAKGSAIKLSKFSKYYLPWKSGTPTSVTLRTDADVQTALQLMGQGKIDMLGAVGPDDSKSAAAMSGVKLVQQSGLSVQILPLNVTKGALKDVRVREAVSLAFDYKAILDYYQGYGDLAVGPLPTTYGGDIATLPKPAQDIAKAKSLLAEAGYSKGLTLTYLGLSGLSYEEFTGTLLQQDLAKVGITLKIQMVPWAQMSQLQSNPDTAADISFLNMSAVTDDPSTMLSSGYVSSNIASKGGYNWSYFENADVDKAVAALPTISDETARNAATLQAVKDINAQYVAIYAAQPKLAQPVLSKWNVKYEVMDYNYVVRFFYATAS